MTARMQFWFMHGSTYTYVSVDRIEALAAAAGVDVEWKPFNVSAIMREQNNIPFAGKPVKTEYMWRDIGRRAARFGIPFAGPTYYPGADAELLCNHTAMVAHEQGWGPAFTRAAYHAWFIGKQRLGAPETVRHVIESLGRDPDAILARAGSDEVRANFVTNTDEARARNIFGAPSFANGDEVFWGDDRLEDAIDWALGRHAVPVIIPG